MQRRNLRRGIVVNRDALVRLVDDGIKACGSLRAAARRAGCSASQLSRIHRMPPLTLSPAMIAGLRRFAPLERRAALERCVLMPAAREQVRRQSASWVAELQRQRRCLRDHCRDATALLRRIGSREIATLVHMTFRLSPAGGELAEARILGSLWRVIEPLVKSTSPRCDWRSMPEDEVRAVLRAGMARERILLSRALKSPILQSALAQLRRTATSARESVPADPREIYRREQRERAARRQLKTAQALSAGGSA
jgi:hypothetical protein